VLFIVSSAVLYQVGNVHLSDITVCFHCYFIILVITLYVIVLSPVQEPVPCVHSE